MLKQMRQGSASLIVKFSLFGLLLLAMAGLALTDVQGMFRQGLSSNTIAKFGREKLTSVEFDRFVQQRLHEQRIKQSDAYRLGLPQQLLKQEVNRRVFAMAAHDTGLVIDDKAAAKQIKEMLEPLVAEKGMTQKEALQSVLQAYGLREEQLVASLKTDLATQELLTIVTAAAHPSQLLLDESVKYRNEWRRGAYFTLTASDLPAVKAPTEAEMKAYYDTISREYALPEYRTLSVLRIEKSNLGADVKISEDRLLEYYNDNISDYKSVETRMVAQAVTPDKETALKIMHAVNKGTDMKKATESVKGTYVKASAVALADMPQELAKPAFEAKAGKAEQPINSQLGWHVVYVEKIIPGTTKSFESVKADIEKDLSLDKVSEVMYERANKIEDDLAGGKTLAEVSKEHGLKVVQIVKTDAHGLDKNHQKISAALPLLDRIIENGFTLKKGAASQLIETPEGDYLIVSADEIYPSEVQPFEKLRSQIESRMTAGNKTKALADLSVKLMERLKKGESFNTLASEYKKSPTPTQLLRRGTTTNIAKIPAEHIAALFAIDKQGGAMAVPAENSIMIMHLEERKIDASKQSEKEADNLAAVLSRTMKQDMLEQYRLALMEKYNVSVNEKLLNEMYAPKDDEGASADE